MNSKIYWFLTEQSQQINAHVPPSLHSCGKLRQLTNVLSSSTFLQLFCRGRRFYVFNFFAKAFTGSFGGKQTKVLIKVLILDWPHGVACKVVGDHKFACFTASVNLIKNSLKLVLWKLICIWLITLIFGFCFKLHN